MFDQVTLAGINHLLRNEHWAARRLAPFAGREARLSMSPFELAFRIGKDGLLEPATGAAPSVDITLSPTTPFRIFEGPEALTRDAHISGAADFADALGFVLRNLQWDIAEDLSKIFGDILAQRMVNLGSSLQAWAKQAVGNLQENLHEYTAYEQQTFLNRATFTPFTESVQALHDKLTELEKAIGRLDS